MLALPAEPFLVAAGTALATAALLGAAAEDLQRRTIPNTAVGCVGIASIPYLALLPPAAVIAHLALGTAGLLLGASLFARGWFGGGDVKLFAVTLLWSGPDLLRFQLALTALAIMVQALLLLGRQAVAARHQPDHAAETGVAVVPATMALGVSIAVGGIGVILVRAGLLASLP